MPTAMGRAIPATATWTARRRRLEPLLGTGPGSRGACFIWRWPHVFRHCVGGGKHADAPRRRSRARPGGLPWCRRDALWIIAPTPQESVITRILRHCKLAFVLLSLPSPGLPSPRLRALLRHAPPRACAACPGRSKPRPVWLRAAPEGGAGGCEVGGGRKRLWDFLYTYLEPCSSPGAPQGKRI